MEDPKNQNSNLDPPSPVASVVDSNSIDTASESSLPFEFEYDNMDGTDLQEHELSRRLLFVCAECVAKEDYEWAWQYLSLINRAVSPLAPNSVQRLAFWFAQGLTARFPAAISSTLPSYSSHVSQILEAYQILYQACPGVKASHKAANQAILQAFENEDCVHVIDIGISFDGNQWPELLHSLASRPGGPPFIRLTAVGCPPEYLHRTGKNLTELAINLKLQFKFHPVGLLSLQDLKPHMFHRQVGEALAVNCINVFHQLSSSCLSNLLVMIRNQAPNIVTLVEREASLNEPCFNRRFHEAWFHYAALFSLLSAVIPEEDSPLRMMVEQHIFAPQIHNILACEGTERVERYEKLEKWKKVMTEMGFRGVPMSAESMAGAARELEMYDGYSYGEETGCLVLYWKTWGVVSISAWH